MRKITKEQIDIFERQLYSEERAPGTIEKYLRDAREFVTWLGEQELTREAVAGWKEHLLELGLAPVTVNSKLAAVNRFVSFLGRGDCRVKYLRIQRKLFRDTERELTKKEYLRLLETAEAAGKHRLALIMETICATGIRVSELKYLTVEAAKAGRVDISLKGKVRTILIQNKLCRKLLKYAKKEKTASGEIFLTRSGRGLTRRQIWAEMKGLCTKAGIAATKVFPHNLRHLFARTFYRACHDVAKLADVLGHSHIETTRIYLISTGKEHARYLDRLGLIC